jgi:hypothetical protein
MTTERERRRQQVAQKIREARDHLSQLSHTDRRLSDELLLLVLVILEEALSQKSGGPDDES